MVKRKYRKNWVCIGNISSLICLVLILTSFEVVYGKNFVSFDKLRGNQAETELSIDKKLDQEKLKQDFAIFRQALEEGHPGLYRYSNKAYLDRHLNSIERAIVSKKDIKLVDFYWFLAVSVGLIKDTHTNVYLSEQTTRYHLKNDKFLPFKLKYIGNQPHIIADYGSNIPVGSKLISINKRSIKEINEMLLASVSSDGDNLTRKYKKIEEDFDWRYYLFIERPNSFKIEYVDAVTKEPRKKEVLALSANEVRAFLSSKSGIPIKPRETKENPLKLQFEERLKTAILTIKTFDSDLIEKANQNYTKFLETAFTKIKEKNVENLIIDLRDNGGGRDNFGILLFSYLVNKEFNYYDYLETSTDNYSFLKYSNKDASFNKAIKNLVVPFAPGKYRIKKSVSANLSKQKPQKNNFSKKVWVLINGKTSSTAAEFCSIAHSHNRANFVGEETGGGYSGNTSGTTMILTLPNSKIRVFIPLIKYVLAVSDYSHPRRGILPDYPIQPNINDILKNADVELPYALDLIKEQSRN